MPLKADTIHYKRFSLKRLAACCKNPPSKLGIAISGRFPILFYFPIPTFAQKAHFSMKALGKLVVNGSVTLEVSWMMAGRLSTASPSTTPAFLPVPEPSSLMLVSLGSSARADRGGRPSFGTAIKTLLRGRASDCPPCFVIGGANHHHNRTAEGHPACNGDNLTKNQGSLTLISITTHLNRIQIVRSKTAVCSPAPTQNLLCADCVPSNQANIPCIAVYRIPCY